MEEAAGVFERRGTGIRYWVSGRADAPVVVLSHSACADHTMWDDQVPALGKRYRVVVWDAPGQGLSQPLPPGFTFDTLVEDFVALLDHLGAERPVLIGHSMGGNLSQEVVFRHPKRVSAMALVDCTDNTAKLSAAERIALASAGPVFALYPFRILKRESVTVSAEKPESRQRLAQMFDRVADKRSFVTILMRTTDCLHFEPGYRVPVPMMLIRGEKDRLGNIAKAMPRMAQNNKAEYVVVSDAGHMSNMDAPDLVNKRLLRFLDGLKR
jgi:3-oxoadipate enol-lactonase